MKITLTIKRFLMNLKEVIFVRTLVFCGFEIPVVNIFQPETSRW
jgi:hypothetical protein